MLPFSFSFEKGPLVRGGLKAQSRPGPAHFYEMKAHCCDNVSFPIKEKENALRYCGRSKYNRVILCGIVHLIYSIFYKRVQGFPQCISSLAACNALLAPRQAKHCLFIFLGK